MVCRIDLLENEMVFWKSELAESELSRNTSISCRCFQWISQRNQLGVKSVFGKLHGRISWFWEFLQSFLTAQNQAPSHIFASHIFIERSVVMAIPSVQEGQKNHYKTNVWITNFYSDIWKIYCDRVIISWEALSGMFQTLMQLCAFKALLS